MVIVAIVVVVTVVLLVAAIALAGLAVHATRISVVPSVTVPGPVIVAVVTLPLCRWQTLTSSSKRNDATTTTRRISHPLLVSQLQLPAQVKRLLPPCR